MHGKVNVEQKHQEMKYTLCSKISKSHTPSAVLAWMSTSPVWPPSIEVGNNKQRWCTTKQSERTNPDFLVLFSKGEQ